ncbi:uncharacterized protein L201_004197 [Kwoniella dendrophila CBS 6074]|uniref:Uncharacterized protein n=1 Tax=Kwoniella dendrophila CBS 6074 TaxID=1295534 RepID=A0AAX4JV29_9TREE
MPPKFEKEAWNDDHTTEVIRAIIQTTLINRSTIYSLPSLQGVSDNGGDRINKKIQQILKKMCDSYPGSQGIVEEEVKNVSKNKNNSKTTPSPKNSPKKSPKNKKRKVEQEDEEDEKEDEE